MRGPASTRIVFLLFLAAGSPTLVPAPKPNHEVPKIKKTLREDLAVHNSTRHRLFDDFSRIVKNTTQLSKNHRLHEVHQLGDHDIAEDRSVIPSLKKGTSIAKKTDRSKKKANSTKQAEKNTCVLQITPLLKRVAENDASQDDPSKSYDTVNIEVKKVFAHIESDNRPPTKDNKKTQTNEPTVSPAKVVTEVPKKKSKKRRPKSYASTKTPKAASREKKFPDWNNTVKPLIKPLKDHSSVKKSVVEAFKIDKASKRKVISPKPHEKVTDKKLKELVKNPTVHVPSKKELPFLTQETEIKSKVVSRKGFTGLNQPTLKSPVKTSELFVTPKPQFEKASKIAIKIKSDTTPLKTHGSVFDKRLKELAKNPTFHALSKAVISSESKQAITPHKAERVRKLVKALKDQASVKKPDVKVSKKGIATKQDVTSSKPHKKVKAKKLKEIINVLAHKGSTGLNQQKVKSPVKKSELIGTPKPQFRKASGIAIKSKSNTTALKTQGSLSEKRLKELARNTTFHGLTNELISSKSKPDITPPKAKPVKNLAKTPKDQASVKKPGVKFSKKGSATKQDVTSSKPHKKVKDKKLKVVIPAVSTPSKSLAPFLTEEKPVIHKLPQLQPTVKKSMRTPIEQLSLKKPLLKTQEKSRRKLKESVVKSIVKLNSLPKAEAEKYQGYLEKAIASFNSSLMTTAYNKRRKNSTVVATEPDGSFIMGFDEKHAMCFIHFIVNGQEVEADDNVFHFTLCIPHFRTLVKDFAHYMEMNLYKKDKDKLLKSSRKKML